MELVERHWMDKFFSLLHTTTSCCKWSKIWLGSAFVGCPPGHHSWSLVVLSVHKSHFIRYRVWNKTFYAPPPESGGVLCYTLRNFECLSVCLSVRPSVSAHHHSCIGNSSYSFRPILLKLYRCFKDGLKICILFFQNPEIIFYRFFPIFMPRHQKVAGHYVIPSEILSVRLSVRPSVRQRPPPFLYRQLLLQF